MSEEILKTIKTRRVIREMSDKSVELPQLKIILEAGRWAPAGGNMRALRFVVIQDPKILHLIRTFSPGMFQRPQAMILLCLDLKILEDNHVPDTDLAPYMDIGATMQTMMLAAHGLGVGSGPVTSFSHEAVREILNLPPNLSPELILCIGYAAPPGKSQMPMRPKKKVTWQSLTFWERFKD